VFGKKYTASISVSGGKRVFQLNNENPIDQLSNTISTLSYKNNFMKLYAADFVRINFLKGIGGGITFYGNLQFQNRAPLENTTDYSWNRKVLRPYTPNYPSELVGQNFQAHQAAIVTAGVNFRPGARYVEFPDRTINIGSKWPTINLQYTKGLHQVFGSDVDYDKWMFAVRDNLNFKMAGRFNYRAEAGGFLNTTAVFLPDLNHMPGNRLIRSSDFMTVFQLPQYYLFSNSDRVYTTVFAEHHFNGFLTNKIPGIKQLNWHLVTGAAAMWLQNKTYAEWHVGFENIFRFFRVDLVTGYQQGAKPRMEFRIGSVINVGEGNDD
jgi:hypothetical protein